MPEFVGIDVGAVRVGIAVADNMQRLASPCTTVAPSELVALIRELAPQHIVVGLPRNLDGDDTAQTQSVRAFTEQTLSGLSIEITFQDEAGTSSLAKDRLRASGRKFDRREIDAGAATIILQDYLDNEA